MSTVELPKHPRGQGRRAGAAGGAIFARGRSVDLVVALGADMVEVPDVVGNDTPAAELLHHAARDSSWRPPGSTAPRFPPARSSARSPAAGTKVRVGSQVSGRRLARHRARDRGRGAAHRRRGTGELASASGGTGSGSSTSASNCTASYPSASVWSSGGDIYIRLTPGRRLATAHQRLSWDTNPMLVAQRQVRRVHARTVEAAPSPTESGGSA